MFPSSIPLLPALQLVLIVALIAFVVFMTGNVLAVLLLAFAWSPPPFVGRDESGTDARSIGFTADLTGEPAEE